MKIIIQFLASLSIAFAFTGNFNVARSSTQLFMSDTKSGTVKWFNTMKGFGFIIPDDDGPDVFVHQTEIKAEGFRSLADGESVEFIPEQDDNGRWKATKVTGPGGANVQVRRSFLAFSLSLYLSRHFDKVLTYT